MFSKVIIYYEFSKITKVEFVPVLPEGMLDLLKQEYNAEDEEGIINNAFDRFGADETFSNLYIKFDGKQTYTYDPFMDREATWVFYQTSENEGFISFYAELDINDGNPDPIVCPEISYPCTATRKNKSHIDMAKGSQGFPLASRQR